MNNFDLKKFLVENKLTTNSKALTEADTDSVKLFDFPEDLKDVKAYEELGFNVEIDDPANKVYSAEMYFKGYDWMAVFSVLEDAARFNLKPNLEYNGETYEFKEARELADEKAAEGTYPEELAEYDIKSTGEEEIIYEVEVLDEDGKIKSYTKLNAEKFDLYIKNRPLPVTIKFKNRTVRAVTKITGVTDDMGRPMNL